MDARGARSWLKSNLGEDAVRDRQNLAPLEPADALGIR